MGMSRMSIFLHTLASSSGVNVGGLSESVESDSLFRQCSMYVDGFSRSSFAAIGKEEAEEGLRGEEEREGESLEESPNRRRPSHTIPWYSTLPRSLRAHRHPPRAGSNCHIDFPA